ncbi:fimbrial tip adhesin FimD [Bacteroides pyogenes]|uniref:fimbrial tip adhesin FimD n=2 Tax=Bacteria TaxID=2 RepID=UPI0011E3C8BF|nr:fimbrial protein [Bacteroides pyogenes]MBR8708825.1 Major fimbrium tip subunit FimD [Bacteroides pyogenes]MBR8717622.1 Major fimbrium tip subunit FimD [Bacteroides pyogenes]MBR8747125.1 Major fimbrium tip subunit FimD [Bacteroides pyogenes]MBR8757469.1 Major fimbrium tip subunit FimD [Bacteroides pyogenes]MBR8780729.1 Major fimbrium tip subunit FimD [Bacteroides pyogenes]
MKKAKHIFYALFAALSVFVFASCLSDNLEDCGCADCGKLSLQIKVPKSAVITRADEPGVGNENTITSLKLYFFEGETMKYRAAIVPPIAENTDILLPIEDTYVDLFQGNVSYTVYAVANLDDELWGKTLTEFKQHVVSKAIGSVTNGDFVMMASVVPAANLKLGSSDNRIGNFELKRAAVKARVKLTTFSITGGGYTLGQPTIQLKNVTDRGYLDHEALPDDAEYSDSDEAEIAFNGTPSAPFYSYPNFWSDIDESTYFLLTLPITKTSTGEEKNYYYRVPLNGSETSVKANHLYEITVAVSKLGSLDPADPAPVDAFFSVKNWEEKLMVSEIKAPHYLMVSETYVEMKNIDTYFIGYSTSDPVAITDVKGKFIYVSNQTGQPVIEDCTGDQIPQVTLQAGSKIKVYSKVPENYIPKKITFTIGHQASTGIDPIEVTLWQYPGTFITNTTGIRSSWRPDGVLESHLNNKSIYRITNLVPSQLPPNTVLAFPPTTEVGFYERNGYWGNYEYVVKHTDYITEDSEEAACMISPNFELASQLGATNIMGYKTTWGNGYLRYYSSSQGRRYALHTCALYTETRVENGQEVILDDWRLPTRAEIQLIDQMQQQGTAVTEIMTGKYYWSGLSSAAIKITLPTASGNATSYWAHVRCVRDIKAPPFDN